MVNLKIGETVLSKNIDINLTGTIDALVSGRDNYVEVMAPRQLSLPAWISKYTKLKKTAMALGGSLQDDNVGDVELYNFEKGYCGAVLRRVDKDGEEYHILTSLHGVSGSEVSGELDMLPSKTIDIGIGKDKDTSKDEIRIDRAPNIPDVAKLYHDIHKLIWRMYHCLNSISGRLQIYAPKMPIDGSAPNVSTGLPDKRLSNMGRYLGTFQQYQAIVARWNQYAWSNTFYLDIVEAGERVAITIGYTNLECYRDNVTYSLKVTIDPDSDEAQDVTYKSELLTIYNQGTDSTIDTDNADISTAYTRNDSTVSGTGYEGAAPAAMTSVGLETEITTNIDAAEDGKHAMYAEQYHRNLVAIAPCIGIDKEYRIQEGSPTMFRKLKVEGKWTFTVEADGETYTKIYTKTKDCNIAAVGVESGNTDGGSV